MTIYWPNISSLRNESCTCLVFHPVLLSSTIYFLWSSFSFSFFPFSLPFPLALGEAFFSPLPYRAGLEFFFGRISNVRHAFRLYSLFFPPSLPYTSASRITDDNVATNSLRPQYKKGIKVTEVFKGGRSSFGFFCVPYIIVIGGQGFYFIYLLFGRSFSFHPFLLLSFQRPNHFLHSSLTPPPPLVYPLPYRHQTRCFFWSGVLGKLWLT